ncbi:cutinase family protein [Mycolicibacterium monacense]|uniref:Cutinase n=4 Tax=Mycobacteriaceae TaxID=1762 RepID=A0AAD1IXK8_MYCMB|nr:cutinase family protein [Mycolicibacterium monacense]MDA4101890.1 cutinase [Mycolicibacterium monacense DSM 44395]OBB65402.1 cutinase [Mycolicibacterium monacense]ORB15524.1 cutinase [Mycolicibacterium monacense DSM 44395]QHP84828.1 cutinase family protein [Mycolicibacterium monacense DSM 44395]BBZ62358.1 cutinase [Mycolicibacterium monacense]
MGAVPMTLTVIGEGLGFVFRRLHALAGAVALGGAALIGLAGTADAQPQCPDVHWIGAAGSGERGAEVSMNDGMGRVISRSRADLQQLVASDGRTMTSEAVVYPATEVPEDGGILDWAGFISSVDAGTAALANQYATFVQQCPTSKVVLAGYSQGAMVVHRNLHTLGASPNFAGALLIADGDRLPTDPTYNLGSVTSVPGAGKGVAQDWPILAHAPAPLPPHIGARTVSVCELGDAVCDYDPDAEDVTATGVAVHTSYARSTGGGYTWTSPLYQLLGPAAAAAPADTVTVAAG